MTVEEILKMSQEVTSVLKKHGVTSGIIIIQEPGSDNNTTAIPFSDNPLYCEQLRYACGIMMNALEQETKKYQN